MQMKDLMHELNSCDVHFIRCIKPNEKKQKNLFVSGLALNQIRYLGVLDSIKVRKESYPIRIKYLSFFERFSELNPEFKKIRANDIEKNKDIDFKEIAKKLFIYFSIMSLIIISKNHQTSSSTYGNKFNFIWSQQNFLKNFCQCFS